MVENGEGPGALVITTVTTTQVPCCLVDVVELCHWTVEHLRGKSGISNDTILSQLRFNQSLSPVTLAFNMHRTGQLHVHT